MSRRLKQAVVVFVAVFAAAQLVRPNRANPPTDAGHSIQSQVGTAHGLVAVLDRACRDCHTNATVWPWYTQIAPVSWAMASAVTKGRAAVNFSDWAAYTPGQQRKLLTESCRDASAGRMPGPYALVRPETRLSTMDIETICAAARTMESARSQ